MTATFVIYGFIVLGTAGGVASGFDGQVRKLGSGVKSMIITLVLVFVFGSTILSTPIVSDVFDDIQASLGDSLLGQDGIYRLFRYVILFFVMLLLLKVAAATLGAFTTTQDGEADWLNKGLGGALACALCVCAVMFVIWVMSILPSAEIAIAQVKDSSASIFYSHNFFLSLFGTL
ncbi:MAG: hypothetical protein LBK70_02525 [Clostridiales bacterium]|jgi:hypothetical protein|nr:hypothetical protein [Clostridiales bacterium]